MTGLTDSAGNPLPPAEAPSEDLLRAYGDSMFLAFRSDRHATMSVANLRLAFEPPLLLGQYRIFRFDGVPRAIYTWAWLSPDAERRYVRGELLRPEDWQSRGGQFWIIDLIAPYRGLMPSIGRWAMEPGNVNDSGFRFRRVEGARDTRRIVQTRFGGSGKRISVLRAEDFA